MGVGCVVGGVVGLGAKCRSSCIIKSKTAWDCIIKSKTDVMGSSSCIINSKTDGLELVVGLAAGCILETPGMVVPV